MEPLAPPSTLSPEAQARWSAVLPQLTDRAIDADLLATYCQVWVRWRQAEDGIAKSGQLVKNHLGHVVRSPLLQAAKDASQQVRALEQRLGLDSKPAEPIGDGGALLTRRELADRFHVHMQTVTKWEREGMPIAERGRKGRASRYREEDVRDWLSAREQAAKTSGHVDVAQERARKERAQAVLAEQLAATRARLLLSADEVARVWSGEVAAVRSIILASYTSQADKIHRIATLEGVGGVEAALKELAHEVLRQLADPDRPVDVVR